MQLGVPRINRGEGWPAADLVWDLLQAVSGQSGYSHFSETLQTWGELVQEIEADPAQPASGSVGGMEDKLLKAKNSLTDFVKNPLSSGMRLIRFCCTYLISKLAI